VIRFLRKGEEWFDWLDDGEFEWYGVRVRAFEALLTDWARTWGPGAGWPRSAAADTLARKFGLEIELHGVDSNPPPVPKGATP